MGSAGHAPRPSGIGGMRGGLCDCVCVETSPLRIRLSQAGGFEQEQRGYRYNSPRTYQVLEAPLREKFLAVFSLSALTSAQKRDLPSSLVQHEACTSSWHNRGAYPHQLSSYALLSLAAFRARGARLPTIRELSRDSRSKTCSLKCAEYIAETGSATREPMKSKFTL